MNDEGREPICRTCHMCSHVYGKFRAQCPACGTPTPHVERFGAPPKLKVAKPKRERKPKPQRESKTICAFCHARGAKKSCTRCGAQIHGGCRSLHAEACTGQEAVAS